MDIANMSTGSLAVLVTLVGLVVVFAALILLTLIIWFYSNVVQKAAKKPEENVLQKPKAAVPALAPAPVAPVMAAAALTVEDNIPGEVVAAIATAVDYLYSGRPAPVIRQIKRDRSARSAWAAAGLADNTRPF